MKKPARRKPALTRREQNKSDKLSRIKAGSRELFIRKGYDAATTREIARAAGVGSGTLFSYAKDKRDLLFLIFNDVHDELLKSAFKFPTGKSAFDKIMSAFGAYYEFCAKRPQFMRYVLREQMFYPNFTPSEQSARFEAGREAAIFEMMLLVREAKKASEIESGHPDRAVAELILGVVQDELRRWLRTDRPTVEPGLAELASKLEILFSGLSPRRAVR